MNNSRRRPNHDLAVVKIKEQLAKRKNKNNQTDRQTKSDYHLHRLRWSHSHNKRKQRRRQSSIVQQTHSKEYRDIGGAQAGKEFLNLPHFV